MTCEKSKRDGAFTVCLDPSKHDGKRVSPGTCARCKGLPVPEHVKIERKDYRGCQPCKQKMLDQMKKGNDDGIKTSGV